MEMVFPYEAGSPVVSGCVKWPCCGKTWEVVSDKITHVRCPDCGNLYVLALKLSNTPLEPAVWSKGVWVEVLKPFSSKVGATTRDFLVGEKYKVTHDPYGVIGTPSGFVLVEVPHPGEDPSRVVVSSLPVVSLKLVEECNAHPV